MYLSHTLRFSEKWEIILLTKVLLSLLFLIVNKDRVMRLTKFT